jgi:hypothetical protein
MTVEVMLASLFAKPLAILVLKFFQSLRRILWKYTFLLQISKLK